MFSKDQVLVDVYNGELVQLKEVSFVDDIKLYICKKLYGDKTEVHLHEDELREPDNGRLYHE
jgi:hypothetical protein